MTLDPTLHRPQPLDLQATPCSRDTLPGELAQRLLDGESLVLADRYATGRAVLRALGRKLPAPPVQAPYAERQEHRRLKLHAARRLHAPIQDGAVALAESPVCGFLQELYPELSAFRLSFVDVEDLVRAWRFYEEGVHFAVLGRRLHPFYGAYAPTRTEHLELFGTWLSAYEGPRSRAVDVGTGSGVLARMLARSGFEKVLATDLNPNAVESVRRDVVRFPGPVEVRQADLLTDVAEPQDLIVFNPPWMLGSAKRPLDQAMFFEPELFERFFDQALTRLSPEGRVVLVFSNIMRLVQKDAEHPIDAELARGRYRLVQRMQRKMRPEPGRKTREKVEIWELAPG